MSSLLCPDSVSSFYGCARSLIELGDQLGINSFYKKAESKARRGLSVKMLEPQDDLKAELEDLINLATWKMNINEAMLVKINVANQMQGQCKVDTYVIDRLKDLWGKLDEKTKREFLVVDSTSLIDYLHDNIYDKKMIEHISKCLCVDDELGWRWWKCRICPQVNYCFTDCKWHILDKHVHEFLPRNCSRPKRVDKFLADMICCGNWEPVDTSRAVDLIKARVKGREEFIYVNGWCNDWPVAKDEERKEILRQFAEVLKSSCSNDTLPCSLWDWLIDYTEENNPQCICFLDLKSLKYILEYVKQFTTDVRTGLVLAVVDRLWAKSLVNERIDLERGGLNLLLDERLLYEGEHGFDDLGAVRTFKSTEIYEHVIPKGDEIVSWVLDCPEIDTNFVSQVAEGVSYYSKRDKLQTYAKMLGEVEALCDKEDKWRNAYQRSRYALTFRSVCERRVTQDNATKCCFLNVVRDVLQGAESPRFEVLQDKEFMECISELSTTVQNDVIRRSMCRLRKWLNEKVILFF
ncbi:BnaAnng30590D, partial [Brassica napus]